MTERLTPERAVRLLRAKAGELEAQALAWLNEMPAPDHDHADLMADIALVASILADHIEMLTDG
jgi:hypothetical protein